MRRVVAVLAGVLVLPITLWLVARAADGGHPQAAVAAAVAGCAAGAVVGAVLAQVSLAMRTLHGPGDRWHGRGGRDGGGW